MKRTIFIAAYVFFVIIGALFAKHTRASNSYLYLGETKYSVVVADTAQEQEKGLSGRQGLPARQAMLFVFDRVGQRCFWMKDMKFPIDMVWVGENMRITHIERNVSPNTYPAAFCPKDPAKYVIETNANASSNVAVGQIVHIQR